MVEVFKTDIISNAEADLVLSQLLITYPHYKINFDLEDSDNILRVEWSCGDIDTAGITGQLNKKGFTAAILPDVPLKNHLK